MLPFVYRKRFNLRQKIDYEDKDFFGSFSPWISAYQTTIEQPKEWWNLMTNKHLHEPCTAAHELINLCSRIFINRSNIKNDNIKRLYRKIKQLQVVIVSMETSHLSHHGISHKIHSASTQKNYSRNWKISTCFFLKRWQRSWLETNRYSIWKKVDVSQIEMRRHITIPMLRGIIKLSRYCVYWTPVFCVSHAANILGRNRFETKKRFFHRNNIATHLAQEDANHDLLVKVRPLLNHGGDNCRNVEPEVLFEVDGYSASMKIILHRLDR